MKYRIGVVALAAAAALIAGCSSNRSQHQASGTVQGSPAPVASTAPVTTPAASATSSAPTEPTVKLLWSHVFSAQGEHAVAFVVRVENPGPTRATAGFEADVLDKDGTIVGSDDPPLPLIPAHGHFDFADALDTESGFNTLSGIPATVHVTQHVAPQAASPQLQTQVVNLSKGDPSEVFGLTPMAYDLKAKVTNTTGMAITGGVTQQVVLFNPAGQVVGASGGMSSDNVPNRLAPGASYLESWTGIPSLGPAVRAEYSVWPG